MSARAARRRSGGWTQAHVRRLFWRAGFGASAHEAALWSRRGKAATLAWIVDGGPGPVLVGPEPRVNGRPLDPANEWGHDALWWLDRMVRSQRPLVEKLTLFWHNHFATTEQDTPLMLAQNRMFRAGALGGFRPLLGHLMRDPAMQLFLSLADSEKHAPNENFARELMELFTLGSGYTERDIREAARALTGFTSRYANDEFQGIAFDPERHDRGVKQIFGHRGRFGPDDVLDLVAAHPRHAPFLITKLWHWFIVPEPSRDTLRSLTTIYQRSGRQIRPVVRAILSHPALYANLGAPDMVKSPVVHMAGALRTTGTPVRWDSPAWMMESAGQRLFGPPSVAGWEGGPAWMSSNAMRVRFEVGNFLLERSGRVAVPDRAGNPGLTPAAALEQALDATGRPWISPRTRAMLIASGRRAFRGARRDDRSGRVERATMLQRTLRHILLTGPDAQVH